MLVIDRWFCMVDFVFPYFLINLSQFIFELNEERKVIRLPIVFVMTSNSKPFQTTPTSIFVHSIFGLAILVCYYGVLGVFRAALRYVTMGYERFFHRVSRPTPPSKALDPIYGTHHMMKLKVKLVDLQFFLFY